MAVCQRLYQPLLISLQGRPIIRFEVFCFSSSIANSTKNIKFPDSFTSVIKAEKTKHKSYKVDTKSNQTNSKGQMMLRNAQPFLTEVLMEKNKASRSVVVVCENVNNALKICEKYGVVEGMHHTTSKVLVEFKDSAAAEDMMSHSTAPRKLNGFTQHRHRVLTLDKLDNYNLKKEDDLGGRANMKDLAQTLKQHSTLGHCVKVTQESSKISKIQLKYNYFVSQLLDDIFCASMSHCCTMPHGSSLSGLATVGSDLDLVLHPLGPAVYGLERSNHIEGEENLKYHVISQKTSNQTLFEREMIQNIAFNVHHFLIGSSKVVPLPHAKVPIVRFNSIINGGRCDLSCNVERNEGVLASCMLRRICEYDERVGQICRCIRLWAKHNNLTNDNPGHYMINFSLTHLVVYYLQHLQILPPIEELLQSDVGRPSDPVEDQRKAVTADNSDILGELYMQFFDFWAKFDYTNGIDIYQGKTVHHNNLGISFTHDKFPLKIVHTQDNLFNIARRTDRRNLELFVQTCAVAHKKLKETKNIGNTFAVVHRL